MSRILNLSCAGALTFSANVFAQVAEPAAAPVEVAAEQVAQADHESVIMVLDGSGSMWGQVDGKAKIEVARDVIGGLLKDWDQNVHLGLVAYGHRQKGACSDIETLVNVGPVDKDGVMAKINAINPVGKTPITASVKQAAEALKYTEEKATIILVSDGIETCDADPCALAKELEGKGVDFTTHVIGFDVAEEEQASLSCLAENTGGKFFSAANATELTTAMAQTVEAVKEPEPTPVKVAAPEPAPVVAEPPKAPDEQGVQLSAKLCETCELLEEGLYWQIYEAAESIDGKRKRLTTKGAEQPFVPLAAGDYYVTVKYGDTLVGNTFAVESEKATNHVVNMNAGNLRITAFATDGGEKLEDAMYYRIFSASTNLSGKRKQLAQTGSDIPLLKLPAGDYVVQATHGKAVVETPVSVEAGKLIEHSVDMNVGYLKVSAAMAEGAAPLDDGIYFRILEGKADLSGKRDQIDASGGANPLFRLPAGDYVIRATQGKAVSDTPVTVTAGSLTEQLVIQNAARVKAKAVLAAGGAGVDKGVYWRIFESETDLAGKRGQIDASGSAMPVFALPAGDYVLHVKFGGSESEQPFTVAAGDEKIVEVKVNE